MAIQSSFTLTANEIYKTLANMIISQEVFADNLGSHQTLVDKARVDGGLYGDTKTYYATDVLSSSAWGNDAEAANLLASHRMKDPEVQAIKLDVFRQIRLTTDNYMTKRAFADEGTFSSFNSVMLGWLRETKRVYDGTLYNVFIGTNKATGAAQTVSINLDSAASGDPLYGLTGVEKEQMEAMVIARGLADLFVKMGDYSRDFNDYGNLRSYAKDSIKVIWNSKYVNKIKKVDLPTIFHKEGLIDKFEEEILPERYFGDVNASQVAAASNTGQYRSVIEKIYGTGPTAVHVFPGDVIPSNVIIAAGEGYTAPAKDVICKVVVKLPPMMSAFEVGTTFFNPRSLTENHYLTFGHNTLTHLKNSPFITVQVK